MKSYFAKLATRATLPNASPSPSRATPAHDPFEELSTIDSPTSTQHVSASNRSTSESTEPSRFNVPFRTDEAVRRNADVVDVRITPDIESVSGRSTEPATIGEPVERVSRRSEETKSKSPEIPGTAEVLKLEPTVPRLNEIQAEQTALLRKADAFMNSLVERHRETKASGQHKEHSQQESPRQTSIERQPATRLEPAPKPRPQTETSEERPSLVIGNLTVEVMPPPPQPTRPTKPIVVIRGGEGRRAAVVHSSQRFGLGQF